MAKYYLVGAGDNPVRYEIGAGTTSVGRKGTDITIPDAAVSRRHAELVLEGSQLIVRDLGSLNGTFINDEQIQGETGVRSGDRVRFGHVTLSLMEREVTPFPQLAKNNPASATLTTSFQEIREKAEKSRSERILVALSDAGAMLSQRQELSEVYDTTLDLLDRFIKASRIMILPPDIGEGSPNVIAAKINHSRPDEPIKLSRTMLSQILQERKSLLTTDILSDEKWDPTKSMVDMGVHAAMGVPLFDNDRVLGAVYMDSRMPGVTFTEEDMRLLTLVANMVAVKINTSRLEAEERKLSELRQELEVAARIQRKLLPQVLPEVEGYDVFAHLAPCEDVGGDLFDVRRLPNGHVWLTLGDVTGHGIGAAMLMSHVMAGLQFLEEQCHDPVNLAERLEDHLGSHVELGQYVTLFAGLLNPKTGRLLYVNAGHPAAILLQNGGRQELESTGMAVSILPGIQERRFGECMLEPQSTLLVFSDGIPETERAGVLYSEDRMDHFIDALAGQKAEDAARKLLEDVDAFRGDAPVEDDLTLMVIRRT